MSPSSYSFEELSCWKIQGKIILYCRFSGLLDGIDSDYQQFYKMIEEMPLHVYLHSLRDVRMFCDLEPGVSVHHFFKMEAKGVVPLLCEIPPKINALIEMLCLDGSSPDPNVYVFKRFPTPREAIQSILPLKPDESLDSFSIFHKCPFSLEDLKELNKLLC